MTPGGQDGPRWPFVEGMVVHEEVGSTNDLARRMVADPALALPVVVRALRQTRGRGRGSNTWWSDEGSLTATLVLDPSAHGLRAEHEARLALVVAAVIAAQVEGYAVAPVAVGVRWPNDVEAGGRKLAGILTERTAAPRPRLLVGIGVNVTTRLDEAPPEVRAMATTVAEVVGPGGRRPTVGPFLHDLLTLVEQTLPRLAADDAGLAAEWARRDTLLGRRLRVRLPNRIVDGVGRGIDAEGALHVGTGTGVERLFGGQVLRET